MNPDEIFSLETSLPLRRRLHRQDNPPGQLDFPAKPKKKNKSHTEKAPSGVTFLEHASPKAHPGHRSLQNARLFLGWRSDLPVLYNFVKFSNSPLRSYKHWVLFASWGLPISLVMPFPFTDPFVFRVSFNLKGKRKYWSIPAPLHPASELFQISVSSNRCCKT